LLGVAIARNLDPLRKAEDSKEGLRDDITDWFHYLAMNPADLKNLVDDWERFVCSLRPTTSFETPSKAC